MCISVVEFRKQRGELTKTIATLGAMMSVWMRSVASNANKINITSEKAGQIYDKTCNCFECGRTLCENDNNVC